MAKANQYPKESVLLSDGTVDMTCLKQLVKDERHLDILSQKIGEFNVFDVLKIVHHELKHSNVLAWLLNPHGSHLMGRRFLDVFIRRLSDFANESDFLVSAYLDPDVGIKILTEEMNIDILIVAEKARLAIAIENKIWAKEHDKQLSRYRKTLESTYGDGWHRFYFYLTPDGDTPKDDAEHWNPISYREVYDSITEVMSNITESNGAKSFIQQYCKVIEREIMGQSEIEDLCYAIYRRHAQALNQIFSIVGCDGSPLRTLMECVLKKLEDEGKILSCKGKGHYAKPAFHTFSMDKYFGKKGPDSLGSWGNDYLYVFWFDRRDSKKVTLRFELGPYRATENELCKINAMVRAVVDKKKDNDKTPEDQYCRIWQCKNTFNTERKDFSAKVLEDWVRKCIEEVLKQESIWIKNAETKLKENHVNTNAIK